MCSTLHPSDNTTRPTTHFDPIQARTLIRANIIVASIALVVLAAAGAYLAFIAGGTLTDVSVALSAGLTLLVLAGQMVIAVGGLCGHLALLKHRLSMEDKLEERQAVTCDETRLEVSAVRDEVKDLRERLNHMGDLLAKLYQGQQQQADVFASMLAKELERRRQRRLGG